MPLKDFVSRRDQGHAQLRRPSSPRTVTQRFAIDDLKIATPAEPSDQAHTVQRRTSRVYAENNLDNTTHQTSRVYAENNLDNTTHQNGERTIFDTDASTIGDTYTDPDLTIGPIVNDLYAAPSSGPLQHASQLELSPQKRITANQTPQNQAAPRMEKEHNIGEVRDRMPVVHGDSYPSTTSGNPSEPDHTQFLSIDRMPQPQIAETFSYQPMRSHEKQTLARHKQSLPTPQIQPAQTRVQHGQDTYKFVPQGSKPTLASLQLQQRPPAPTSRKDTNAPRTTTKEGRNVKTIDQHVLVEPLQNTRSSLQPHQHLQSADETQDILDPCPSDELDYDPDTFSTMTFDDLKRKPFDHDPRRAQPSLPQRFTRMTLSEQLQDILGLPPDEQDPFFCLID